MIAAALEQSSFALWRQVEIPSRAAFCGRLKANAWRSSTAIRPFVY